MEEEEAKELARMLTNKGISMREIKIKLKDFIGHAVEWFELPQYKVVFYLT